MSQQESHAKISPTAMLVAYTRTFTDIPFAQEIATACAVEQAPHAVFAPFAEMLPRSVPVLELRYKLTNHILARQGLTHLLEIAAGLSPRGLAMTAHPGVVYVATDIAPMIEQAQAIAQIILASRHIERPHLHFCRANALDREELWQAATLFPSRQPMAIITEGLLPYLSHAEKAMLASTIRELLAEYGGVWIIPDVNMCTKPGVARIYSEKRAWQSVQDISNLIERDLESDLFPGQDEFYHFFRDAGFTIEVYPSTEVLEELSSLKHFPLSPQGMEMAQDFQAAILTL